MKSSSFSSSRVAVSVPRRVAVTRLFDTMKREFQVLGDETLWVGLRMKGSLLDRSGNRLIFMTAGTRVWVLC
jgi:hypothetical protein